MSKGKGKRGGEKVLALFPQIPQDGLEDKAYAVRVIADGYFAYLEFDTRQAAEESADISWEGFSKVYDVGGTGKVRVTLLEILRIRALDRVPVEEREVSSDEAGGNKVSPGFHDDFQGSL